MPEPSSGGSVGGRSRPPQPKPRLSLLINKDDRHCPLYENIENCRQGVQVKEEGGGERGEEEIKNKEDNDLKNMATPNSNRPRRTEWVNSRRSILPVPLHTSNNGASVSNKNINKMGSTSGLSSSVNNCKSTVVHNSGRVTATCNAAPSNTSKSSLAPSSDTSKKPTATTTIKCMPYNSPRLAKSSRFAIDNNQQQVQKSFTDKIGGHVKGTVSLSRTGKQNGAIKSVEVDKGLVDDTHESSKMSFVNLKRYDVLSRKIQVPVRHGSIDSISNASIGSTDSLDSNPGLLKTENRKSASIPPLMVATLTNQFNAIIEHNQNLVKCDQNRIKREALVSNEVKSDSVNNVVSSESSSTASATVRSCPSSPLHGSQFRFSRYQKQPQDSSSVASRTTAKSKITPKRDGGVGDSGCNSMNILPKRHISKDSASDNVSRKEISTTVIKVSDLVVISDAGDTNSNIPQQQPQVEQQNVSNDTKALSLVQRAVMNYEVALMKSTSSPELPRKKGCSQITVVPRQSRTLPTATVPPSYNSKTGENRSVAIRTLPHLSWKTGLELPKEPEGSTSQVLRSYTKSSTDSDHVPYNGERTSHLSSSCISGPPLVKSSKPSLDHQRSTGLSYLSFRGKSNYADAKGNNHAPVAVPRKSLQECKSGSDHRTANFEKSRDEDNEDSSTSSIRGLKQNAVPCKSKSETGVVYSLPVKTQGNKIPNVVSSNNDISKKSEDKTGDATTTTGRCKPLVDDQLPHRSAALHKRSSFLFGTKPSLSTDVKSDTTESDLGSLESVQISKEPLDLLAEIDNDPQMLATMSESTRSRWCDLVMSSSGIPSEVSEVKVDPSIDRAEEFRRFAKTPNASFLWKPSTQSKVSQEAAANLPPSTVAKSSKDESSLPSVINKQPTTDNFGGEVEDGVYSYYSEDEHLYEELSNYTSSPVPPLPPRVEFPRALPETDSDLLEYEYAGSFHHSVLRRSLESRTTNKTSSSNERLVEDDCSDGNWTDDDEEDDDDIEDEDDDGGNGSAGQSNSNIDENEVLKSVVSSVRPPLRRPRGKRTTNRRVLARRSWSQSIRDLAYNHELDDRGYTDSEGAWEDEMGSDGSSCRTYSESISDAKVPEEIDSDRHNRARDSFTTDTTDSEKSPTSANEDCGVVTDANRKFENSELLENKVKKVKRHWSWSKTDFRLDFSTKLGKIRMNKKALMESTDDTSFAMNLSPTKKKQWPFKSKNAPKKGYPTTQKQNLSPKKESALFYVPTVNVDGSLASPPHHMAHLDFQVETEATPITTSDNCVGQSTAIISVQDTVPTSAAQVKTTIASTDVSITTTVDISGAIQTTVKKARRISSGGTVSRPKTAPPAPPISSIKFTNASVQGSNTTISGLGSSCSDVTADQESSRQSSSSLARVGSLSLGPLRRMQSDQGDFKSRKIANGDVTSKGSIISMNRSASVASSDSDMTGSGLSRSRARESISSCHSANSNDSYIQIEDFLAQNNSSSQGESLNRVLHTDTSSTISESEDNKDNDDDANPPPPKDFLYLDDTYYIDDDRFMKLSPFDDEPFYQFYTKDAQQRAAQENQIEGSDDDCYESLYQTMSSSEGEASTAVHNIPSAMDLVKSTVGGLRTLWCEVPEVIASGILDTVTPQQRKLQEAMFEVITSEASYLKSLNVLVTHFMLNPRITDDYSVDCVLNKREKHVLFSDVIPVRQTSEKLLAALEERWQENILISDICDILQEHATKYFDVYVKYCSNQLYQDRCLKNLKETNSQFVEILKQLESSPTCQNLSMHSFLMLPMQRITRLPLLVDAIFNRLDHGSKQFESCKQALTTLNKIVLECNEGATRMIRMEEMLILSRQLDFREFKGVALISASRWLVKKGELTRLIFSDSSKLSFGRRCIKQPVYMYLFTDLLIITKKKSEDCFNVVDYCPRNMVQVNDTLNMLPDRLPDGCKNLFQLCMLQNHCNKTVEMYFCCQMESDLTRWVEAVTPRISENPDERIYEEWDCPQVQAVHNYVAQQPDELSLEESDVVNVFRKMADGWYQGERIRDGVQGWFPSTYTVEIVSSHVRARNLRQRYRMLALSQSYLEEKRKEENKDDA